MQFSFLFVLVFWCLMSPVLGADERSFYMGFTPHPFDYSEDAFEQTYHLINKNGDIISHHIDEGVPWEEALLGKSFARNVNIDIERRLRLSDPRDRVFLSLSPLGLNRVDIAGNWAKDSHMALPSSFSGLPLDDPKVIQAYIAYSKRMIEAFSPAYFAYAIEVSELAKDITLSNRFVRFSKHVYATLKAAYPGIKMFPTFVLGNEEAFDDAHKAFIKRLMPYADIFAVSTYPYVWDGVGGNVDKLPHNWFSKLQSVSAGKPLAVSETGFIAKDYRYLSKLVWIKSSEDNQRAYVDRLLRDAQTLNMEFVIWYVPVDYERLWLKMKAQGIDYWFAQWMSSGLFNADLKPRPAFDVWGKWLKKIKKS